MQPHSRPRRYDRAMGQGISGPPERPGASCWREHWEIKAMVARYRGNYDDTWMPKGSSCATCRSRTVYVEMFDAFACPTCDTWAEEGCDDEDCSFCAHRPAKPSGVVSSQAGARDRPARQ